MLHSTNRIANTHTRESVLHNERHETHCKLHLFAWEANLHLAKNKHSEIEFEKSRALPMCASWHRPLRPASPRGITKNIQQPHMQQVRTEWPYSYPDSPRLPRQRWSSRGSSSEFASIEVPEIAGARVPALQTVCRTVRQLAKPGTILKCAVESAKPVALALCCPVCGAQWGNLPVVSSNFWPYYDWQSSWKLASKTIKM